MLSTSIKKQFPIFIKYPDLVYLDSAATSQKPRTVINRVVKFYEEENANVHRGIYQLSEQATVAYESARAKIAQFIKADAKEIIFTKGTTEAINLVATTLIFDSNNEIVVTEMEHHSNLVPWQQKSLKLKAQSSKPQLKAQSLKFISLTDTGQLNLKTLPQLINKNTRLVALTYISNVLGTINPIKEIVKIVKTRNPKTLVLIDAAQAAPHIPVDVKDLGCDFLTFSGHKMLGPTGIGVLWGKKEILDSLPPYQFGGGMITRVEKYHSEFADTPHKFEAGTPPIAQAIGLAAAIDFLKSIGMENICRYEEELTTYALERLSEVRGIEIYGPKKMERCQIGIIAFNLKNIHGHDVAQVLDQHNIAVRAGHHCTMPLHQKLGIRASVRASFYLYNTKKDVDKLLAGIEKVKRVFK